MKVMDILQNRFAAAASLEDLEFDDEGKYMVIEKRDLYQGNGKMATMLQLEMPHDAVQSHNIKDADDDEPEEHTKRLIIIPKILSTGYKLLLPPTDYQNKTTVSICIKEICTLGNFHPPSCWTHFLPTFCT